MPSFSGMEFIEYYDSIYDRVSQEINSNSKRIHSVVITTQINQGVYDVVAPVFSVIPNFNSQSLLPNGFHLDINGIHKELLMQDGQLGGAFECDLPKTETWEQPIVEYLYIYLGEQYRTQMKLWKRWDKRVRLELIREGFGSFFLDTDIVDFNGQDQLKIKARWNDKELSLRIGDQIHHYCRG